MEELPQIAGVTVPIAHPLVTGEALAALMTREYRLVATGVAHLLQSVLNDHYLLPTVVALPRERAPLLLDRAARHRHFGKLKPVVPLT